MGMTWTRRTLVIVLKATQALFLAALLSPAAQAQQPGEPIEGVITAVDGRTLTVARDGGGEATVRIGGRTRVVGPAGGSGADSDFLRPGMRVRFRHDTEVLERVHVTDMPPGVTPVPAIAAAGAPPDRAATRSAPAERQVKARLLDLGRGGEFRADVAGRPERYRLKDPAMLRRFGEGDLVVLTLDPAASDVVTDIRSAAVSGRVVRIDRRAREVSIEVEGREQLYQVEKPKILEDLRAGDRVRFEVEERGSGRKVITAVF